MKQFAFFAAACLVSAPALAGDLVVNVTGVKAKGGIVRAAVYARDPLYRDAVAQAEATASPGVTTIVFKGLPPGSYVVSAFHDADGDGKLGLAAGKLNEGTAISNAEKLRGAPRFAVNRIDVPSSGAAVSIAMSYPEDRSGW